MCFHFVLSTSGIGTGFMPMAVSSAAHPDRVRMVYKKAVKEITAAAGPCGMSMIDGLDRVLDHLDERDEALSDRGIPFNCCT